MNIEAKRGNLRPNVDASAEALPEEGGLRLAEFLQLLQIRKKLIIATALVVFALVATITFQLTPLYSGKALVMLDQRKNNVVDADAVLSGLPSDQTTVQNQIQILQSRTLAEHVVEKANLVGDPEFDPAASFSVFQVLGLLNPKTWFATVSTKTDEEEKAARLDAIADRLESRLSISAVGLSTTMVLEFRSADPLKAARIANAFADAYVEDQLNAKFEATQKATKWLADRLQQLNAQAQAADAAVAQYKADNNLTETAAGVSLVDQQMADLNSQLIIARSNLAEEEAKLGRVSALARAGRADDVTQVVDSPLIAQLRAQETELGRQEAELSSKYGSRHPKLLDLQSQKANLESKIGEEVNRVVATVANDVAEARAKVASLQASLDQIAGQSTTQNQARVKLKALEANAASTRSLYDAFLSRFKATQDQEGIQTPDARILSVSEVPTSPSFPNIPLIMAATIPGSLLFAFFVAMMAERLDNGFRTTAQVESALGVPVIATVPEIKHAADVSPAMSIVERPLSQFAEAIRAIQIGLTLSNVDVQPKVILVTSSAPEEGKTTIALSLARQIARGGDRVVLVDADLRRPSISKALGIETVETGILDALIRPAELGNFLHKDPQSEIYYLAASARAASPPDLLGSAAMESIISALRKTVDYVVIDSAPILPVNDTKLIARLADAVLFVARWEKTPRDAAVSAVNALTEIAAPVAGVVLTRTDAVRFHAYNYGYRGYYGSYAKYYSD